MFRGLLSLFLAWVLILLVMEPGYGQFSPAPAPQYPAQYPGGAYPQNSYPPNQGASQYPQIGQYPPAGQYPQGPHDPNAQDASVDQQHGVARLSIVQGDVNVKRGDTGELVAAVMNAPLMPQDHLQTSGGSRAEVELDFGNLVRLAPNTDVGFADLEYRRYQIQLGAGTIIYRVLRDSNAQAEIDTPSIAIRPVGQGEYRVTVLDDGTTQITVRSGQVEIFSPRGSQFVTAGHTILVRGNPSDPEFQQENEIPGDQFDDWSANRDEELLASQSYHYVSPNISGAEDLDAYGTWIPSQYGQVWQPQPPTPDWSPYSYGEWAYEPYYGWTWIDYAPWGWAPYHYGRWFWNGGRGWCWWPGAVAASYWWSPALVGFFSWGGFGFGVGRLGWVPLAPYEAFHPWWRRGFGYGAYGGFGAFRNTNVFTTYRNAAIRGGAMMASYNGFGGPHQRFGIPTRTDLLNANAIQGSVPISPTRVSYQFASRQAVVNSRLAAVANRQFYYYQQPHSQPAAARMQNGMSLTSQQQTLRGVAPNMQASYAAKGNYTARPNASAGGWQRFGDPVTSNAYRQSFTGTQESSGWHRFGEPQRSVPASNGSSNSRPPSSYGQSYAGPNYRGTYQPRPQNMNVPAVPQRPTYSGAYSGSYGAARPNYGAPQSNSPQYSAPAPHYSPAPAPHYSAPATPHYSAPAPSNHGGGGSHAPSSHGEGAGGGHSSSGGHHGR